MSKIIIVYASMTGNTELMANAVAAGIQESGGVVTMKEAFDTNAKELEQYDGIVLGAYTWGDGELPDDYLDFYDEMEDLELSNKPAAVFGSCDSNYHSFGTAVDTLIEKLTERGARIVIPGLKIELTPSDKEREACKAFGKQFATMCVPHGIEQ
ncbi:flavodoxin [Paenibacillus psychroresistens]|uniref:Flavodoxin n=1 Tax=Paenibacillus psychroresistens TaxID=1778678 RepID=A0A6B8RHL5_9BACL|nr:flavodoxin [Paenibacillus psychroresistens]QGQ95951.1 flavodoxin [Paenibacillus psychroresistens]